MEATRNKPPVPPLSARRHPRRRCFSSALSGPSAEAISHYSHCAALPQLSVSPRHHPYHSLPFDWRDRSQQLPAIAHGAHASRGRGRRGGVGEGVVNRRTADRKYPVESERPHFRRLWNSACKLNAQYGGRPSAPGGPFTPAAPPHPPPSSAPSSQTNTSGAASFLRRASGTIRPIINSRQISCQH